MFPPLKLAHFHLIVRNNLVTTRLTLKASVILLAPVFSVLAACGGAGDPAANAPAESLSAMSEAVRPADYTVDSTAPAGDTGAADATAAQPDQLAAMTAVATGTTGTTVTAAATTAGRDPLKQPFSSNSIWNMPIGSGAQFVAANLSGNPGKNIWAAMPGIDGEHIIMTPTAPMTKLNYSNAGWSGKNRCTATGALQVTVPMPSNYVIPNSRVNSAGVFLMPDKRTIVQTQPVARCTAGAAGTTMAKFANVDLYGTGIPGAHGGSGLSSIGGSIRVGELRPGSTTGPRHALKVNVYAKEALFKCTTRANCFRWPASHSDGYAVGWYGAANGNKNTAMKMGALLAIPPSKSIASLNLETAPAKQLAWTLQNYGAYIVDDAYAPGFDISVEEGPGGSVQKQFKADYGYAMLQRVSQNTAWVRDIQKLVKALYVVNNNTANSIGGGGTPRQPLAPKI
jgi:hypothetical protein